MSKFSERFKELRKSRKLSQQELADLLHTSKSSVNMYERGEREPGLEMLETMADFFNVDMDFLLGKTSVINEAFTNCEPSNISYIIKDDIYSIPLFGSVSAGFGAYASDEILDYIPTVIRNPYEAKETLAIRVTGESMYPKIEDGDIIVVHKQDSVDSGSIAVLLLDGDEGLVKKVEYGHDWIDLISINPEYPPRHFKGSEVTRLRVLGLVRQIIKTV